LIRRSRRMPCRVLVTPAGRFQAHVDREIQR
jgi:hypothetical protein